jgi:hypothetical protein
VIGFRIAERFEQMRDPAIRLERSSFHVHGPRSLTIRGSAD